MNEVLKDILRENEYFEEVKENTFVPKYLGLIINGVVIYEVNWLNITKKELILMNNLSKDHPISSIILENLNSILIITEDGIKEVL